MSVIEDDELGRITVRRTSSSSMRASVAPNGNLRISVPKYAPMFMVRRMIASAKDDLIALLHTRPSLTIHDGMIVGKSHSIHVRHGASDSVRRKGLQIIVTLEPQSTTRDTAIVESVRKEIRTALRKEAKAHLPKRIDHLATLHGFSYTSLRFTHASTRWGSCNSKKAISLNIALMALPFELIDYVLIHELAHTIHLNHSKDFWAEVARIDPDFIQHRAELKRHNPAV